MTKHTIKNVKNAIIIYEDPVEGPRRVIFGEPSEVFNLFLDNAQIIYDRLRKLVEVEKDIENAEDMLEAIREGREWFTKAHSEDAAEKMSMTISYSVFKD